MKGYFSEIGGQVLHFGVVAVLAASGEEGVGTGHNLLDGAGVDFSAEVVLELLHQCSIEGLLYYKVMG